MYNRHLGSRYWRIFFHFKRNEKFNNEPCYTHKTWKLPITLMNEGNEFEKSKILVVNRIHREA